MLQVVVIKAAWDLKEHQGNPKNPWPWASAGRLSLLLGNILGPYSSEILKYWAK
jgi:hypothetical protein